MMREPIILVGAIRESPLQDRMFSIWNDYTLSPREPNGIRITIYLKGIN